jgi:hypothetical protein
VEDVKVRYKLSHCRIRTSPLLPTQCLDAMTGHIPTLTAANAILNPITIIPATTTHNVFLNDIYPRKQWPPLTWSVACPIGGGTPLASDTAPSAPRYLRLERAELHQTTNTIENSSATFVRGGSNNRSSTLRTKTIRTEEGRRPNTVYARRGPNRTKSVHKP